MLNKKRLFLITHRWKRHSFEYQVQGQSIYETGLFNQQSTIKIYGKVCTNGHCHNPAHALIKHVLPHLRQRRSQTKSEDWVHIYLWLFSSMSASAASKTVLTWHVSAYQNSVACTEVWGMPAGTNLEVNSVTERLISGETGCYLTAVVKNGATMFST